MHGSDIIRTISNTYIPNIVCSSGDNPGDDAACSNAVYAQRMRWPAADHPSGRKESI
jgi:hypothetical protein